MFNFTKVLIVQCVFILGPLAATGWSEEEFTFTYTYRSHLIQPELFSVCAISEKDADFDWNSDVEESPPVLPGKAVQIATKEFERIRKQFNLPLMRVDCLVLNCLEFEDSSSAGVGVTHCQWAIWFMQDDGESAPDDEKAMLPIVVGMNGNAVPPGTSKVITTFEKSVEDLSPESRVYPRKFESTLTDPIFVTRVDLEDLKETPLWDPSQADMPPVSPRRALTIANAKRKQLVPDGELPFWQITSIEIVNYFQSSHWYWVVTYEGFPNGASGGIGSANAGGISSAPAVRLPILILMNEHILEHEVSSPSFPTTTTTEKAEEGDK
jgi:hypothetical protein